MNELWFAQRSLADLRESGGGEGGSGAQGTAGVNSNRKGRGCGPCETHLSLLTGAYQI